MIQSFGKDILFNKVLTELRSNKADEKKSESINKELALVSSEVVKEIFENIGKTTIPQNKIDYVQLNLPTDKNTDDIFNDLIKLGDEITKEQLDSYILSFNDYTGRE